MTAETLKPFINTPIAENFTSSLSKNRNDEKKFMIVTIISLVAISLGFIFLGFTIWNSTRIHYLEAEVKSLNKVIKDMQKDLGLNYLEHLHDVEKEYSNDLIDDPSSNKNSIEDDEDDKYVKGELLTEDYYDSYDELVEKINKFGNIGNEDDDDDDDDDEDDEEDDEDSDSVDEMNTTSTSGEDNLYNDYERYKESKKKTNRRTRSVSETPNILSVYEDGKSTKSIEINDDKKQTIRDQSNKIYNGSKRNHRYNRRKFPIKREETLLSDKSMRVLTNSQPIKPAAHFHLHRKIAHRHSPINVESYEGDMYIGHPSFTNDISINEHFHIENGALTVTQPGLYYVYAQVCYNNSHDQNGFIIFHAKKPFLQCLQTVPTNIPTKIHTCHTSGLIYLQTNETIHLRDFNRDHDAVLKDKNNRSYFGLIKI